MNHTAHTTHVVRWRRLATAAAAATLVLSTTFSGLPAYADSTAVAGTVGASATAAHPNLSMRFEQIIEQWAVNTGFDNGDKSHGANAQIWSWMHRDPHDWNSQWIYEGPHLGDNYWTYRNRWSDKCLGVEALEFSARVEQQTCNGSLGQLWKDVYAGMHNGRYTYTFKNKGASDKLGAEMVLTVDHTGYGAPVRVQVKSNVATLQRWFTSYEMVS